MKNLLPCLILACMSVAGCQGPAEPAPPAPTPVMDANALEQLRAQLRSENGEVVVAGVTRVLPSDDYLAVAGVNPSDFVVGTPVSVIDANRATLAHGNVVAIVNDEVHIRFTTVGARRPQAGDAVIPFPRK